MKRRTLLHVPLFIFATLAGYAADEAKGMQRIGDLRVTLLGTREVEPQAKSDHHLVLIHFRAQSIAKQVLCVGFSATLKASFGLQYRGQPSLSNAFRIHELLPAESTEGEYEFLVKNGSAPLQVTLKPTSRTQTCTPEQDSVSAIWHSSEEFTFDILSEHRDAVAQPIQPGQSTVENVTMIRVFLNGAKGAPPKENAIRAFRDSCPQVRVTTVQNKADYVVTLIPATFKQSKNEIMVLNAAGDLIHSGATFTLHNAANGACVAIIKDSKAAPPQKGDAP